jgi:hypothetical protein
MAVISFLIAFFAFLTLLWLIMGIIASVTNPDFTFNEKGEAVDSRRNFRMWMAVITSVFWALLLTL